MEKEIFGRLKLNINTPEYWEALTEAPLKGEMIIYQGDESSPTPRIKIGDGITLAKDLPFVISAKASSGNNSSVEGNVENNAALGEYSRAEGDTTTAGSLGFRIIGKDAENKFYIVEDEDGLANQLSAGDVFSVSFTNNYDLYGTITNIEVLEDISHITVDNFVDDNLVIEPTRTQNIIRVPAKPEVGYFDAAPCSHAEGKETIASGYASHAEGYATQAVGRYAHAEGQKTTASYSAHAEGAGTKALGDISHAEGNGAQALGRNAHAEGYKTTASGENSHTEGGSTKAMGQSSHAEGQGTQATGIGSHAEGYKNLAKGDYSHVEGKDNNVYANSAHIEGRGSIKDTKGKYAHILGIGEYDENDVLITRKNGHTIDWNGNAWFAGEVTVGVDNKKLVTEDKIDEKIASFVDSAPETLNTLNELAAALGDDPNFATTVASELGNKADKDNIQWIDIKNKPSIDAGKGAYSIIEGDGSNAVGYASHAEGEHSVAEVQASHAEGYYTIARGISSHAEGDSSISKGANSHAEGFFTEASGEASHAEGINSLANGYASHSSGYYTIANGDYSYVNGYESKTIGKSTQAIGQGNIAGSMSFKVKGISPESYDCLIVEMTEEEYIYIKDTIKPSNNNPIPYCAYLNHQYQGNISDIGKVNDYGWMDYEDLYCFWVDTEYNPEDVGTTIKDSSYLVFMKGSNQGNLANGTGAHAEGYNTQAQGLASHTEGYNTNVYAKYGHAEGHSTQAGHAAHAEGQETKAYGQQSHAEGWTSFASGIRSHAEGSGTQARGEVSHAEGAGSKTGQKYFDIHSISKSKDENNIYKIHIDREYPKTLSEYGLTSGDVYSVSRGAERWIDRGTIVNVFDSYVEVKDFPYTSLDPTWSNRLWVLNKPDSGRKTMGNNTHAEGQDTIANGEISHAESYKTQAAGDYSHAEGQETLARGQASHAEGKGTLTKGEGAHAEGVGTTADGKASHVEGSNTLVTGIASHAEGYNSWVEGNYSHAEGTTTVIANYGHAEGNNTKVSGDAGHAEGKSTIASGPQSHAEGSGTQATNWNTHAEGVRSIASGLYSHAEGTDTQAQGQNSHTEGENTIASNTAAHAEGASTKATGANAHSEGNKTTASGPYSHAENNSTIASGEASHAEGKQTQALGYQSHAEGNNTIASKDTWNQHVQGRFNTPMDNNYAHIVGNGTSENDRRNAHTLDWNGNAWFAGNVTIGADKKKLATEDKIDEKIASLKPSEDSDIYFDNGVIKIKDEVKESLGGPKVVTRNSTSITGGEELLLCNTKYHYTEPIETIYFHYDMFKGSGENGAFQLGDEWDITFRRAENFSFGYELNFELDIPTYNISSPYPWHTLHFEYVEDGEYYQRKFIASLKKYDVSPAE